MTKGNLVPTQPPANPTPVHTTHQVAAPARGPQTRSRTAAQNNAPTHEVSHGGGTQHTHGTSHNSGHGVHQPQARGGRSGK